MVVLLYHDSLSLVYVTKHGHVPIFLHFLKFEQKLFEKLLAIEMKLDHNILRWIPQIKGFLTKNLCKKHEVISHNHFIKTCDRQMFLCEKSHRFPYFHEKKVHAIGLDFKFIL